MSLLQSDFQTNTATHHKGKNRSTTKLRKKENQTFSRRTRRAAPRHHCLLRPPLLPRGWRRPRAQPLPATEPVRCTIAIHAVSYRLVRSRTASDLVVPCCHCAIGEDDPAIDFRPGCTWVSMGCTLHVRRRKRGDWSGLGPKCFFYRLLVYFCHIVA